MIRREELARVLAKSITGADPEAYFTEDRIAMRIDGTFSLLPAGLARPRTEGAPLWTHFLTAADEAIKLFEASL